MYKSLVVFGIILFAVLYMITPMAQDAVAESKTDRQTNIIHIG